MSTEKKMEGEEEKVMKESGDQQKKKQDECTKTGSKCVSLETVD